MARCKSFTSAFLQILLLMALLFRSFRGSLICLVPNLAPLFFIFVRDGLVRHLARRCDRADRRHHPGHHGGRHDPPLPRLPAPHPHGVSPALRHHPQHGKLGTRGASPSRWC
ncbi:MAG: hypothetical protein MZW92_39375 [Comamonadaceae bacterium]|nr:hypothetical protein [Comamonadaceae bacterium]